MFKFRRRLRYRRKQINRKDYLARKEEARLLVHAKIIQFNTHYQFEINRLFIKNQRSCWGSCSENKNLSFNYRLIYLEPELIDYVIVHELCHVQELNHSPRFWELVAQTIPSAKVLRKQLNKFEIK